MSDHAAPTPPSISELDFLVRQLDAIIGELQADLLTRGQAA